MTKGVVINDKGWRKLLEKVRGLAEAHVKVGIVGSHAHETQGDLSLIEIATFNEFGTATIPERSFIRKTFVTKKAELGAFAGKLAHGLLSDRLDLRRALGLLGEWGASAVKKTITAGNIQPPNAPSTIARKGSSRPLVDTGQLVNAISYEVVEGGGE